jgi:tRNA nucleotidyltransferase/poly(A) polymerase
MLNRFLDVFSSLNSQGVKYVVIGGIAAIAHGVPRATFDLDILIEATPDNARRLLDALAEAGFGTALLTTSDELLKHEITIFRDRLRIDVQTSTPGLAFEQAWQRRVAMYLQRPDLFRRVPRGPDRIQESRRSQGRSRRCQAS